MPDAIKIERLGPPSHCVEHTTFRPTTSSKYPLSTGVFPPHHRRRVPADARLEPPFAHKVERRLRKAQHLVKQELRVLRSNVYKAKQLEAWDEEERGPVTGVLLGLNHDRCRKPRPEHNPSPQNQYHNQSEEYDHHPPETTYDHPIISSNQPGGYFSEQMDGALQELLTLQKRQAKDLEELKTAVRMSGNPVKQTRTYQPLGANRGTSVRGAVRIGARGGETEREDKALQTDPERRDDQNGLAASQDPKKSVEPVAAVVGKSRTGLKLRDKALDATVARELGESDKRLARSWKRAMKEVEEERKRSRRPPYVRRKSAVKEQKSGGDARGGKDTKIIKSNPAQSESAWLEEELVKFRRQLAEEAEQFRVRRSIGKENTEENRDTHELESLTPPPMTPVDQSPEPSVESHSTPQPATPPSVNTQPPQSVAPTEPVLTDEIFKYVNELFAQRIEPLLARAREEIGTSNPGLPSGALEVLRDKLPQARSLESLLREGAPEVDDHVAGEADGAVPAGGNAVDVVGRAEEADRPVFPVSPTKLTFADVFEQMALSSDKSKWQPPTTSDQTKQTAPSTPSSSTSKKRPNPPFETLIMDGFQSAAPTSSHEPLKPDDHPPRIQTSPPIDDDPPPFGLALPDPVINRVMTGQSAYFQHLRDALRLPSNAADFNGEGSMDPTPWDVIESIADDLLEEVLDLNAAELDGFADDFVERLFREEFFPADQSGADMEM